MILIYYYLIAMGIFSLVIFQHFGMSLIKSIKLKKVEKDEIKVVLISALLLLVIVQTTFIIGKNELIKNKKIIEISLDKKDGIKNLYGINFLSFSDNLKEK